MNRAIVKSISTRRSLATKVCQTTELNKNTILREKVRMLENKIDEIEKRQTQEKIKHYLYSSFQLVMISGLAVYCYI